MSEELNIDVSVVMPVLNAEEWLHDSLSPILHQTFKGNMEVSIYNDGSSDSTGEILQEWTQRFEKAEIRVVISSHENHSPPKGTGYGRNRAIEQSSGKYLCFYDAVCNIRKGASLIFRMILCLWTESRYNMLQHLLTLMWIKSSSAHWQLLHQDTTSVNTQIYKMVQHSVSMPAPYPSKCFTIGSEKKALTAYGPTLIQPTWFCSRELFEQVGEFSEQGKGTPEDLVFFYRHLSQGRELLRVDRNLLTYRYHHHCQSLSIKRGTIWRLRVEYLQTHILSKLTNFTIWNAGKQGKRLYRSITLENRAKVVAFCDVDKKKIEKGYYTYEQSKERIKPQVPIIHFTSAIPPLILCVKLDMTGGEFEKNLASLQLREGVDYHHFS